MRKQEHYDAETIGRALNDIIFSAHVPCRLVFGSMVPWKLAMPPVVTALRLLWSSSTQAAAEYKQHDAEQEHAMKTIGSNMIDPHIKKQ